MKPTVAYGHTTNDKFRIGIVYCSNNESDKTISKFMKSASCLELTAEYYKNRGGNITRVYSIPVADCDPADRIEANDARLETISKSLAEINVRVIGNVEFKTRTLHEIGEEILKIAERCDMEIML